MDLDAQIWNGLGCKCLVAKLRWFLTCSA